MLHVVLRPIPGPEGPIPSGTLVEPKDWRNLKPLVNGGLMRPVTPDDIEGLDTLEVDKYGISEVNILTPKEGNGKPKPKTGLKIPKKKG